MHDTTASPRTGVPRWLVSIVLFLALAAGGGGAAWLVHLHNSTTSAAGPGCPLLVGNVTWASAPTQVIRYDPPARAPAPVNLQPSQTLEIHLFGPFNWLLESQNIPLALTLQTPDGYPDAADKSCVWRFRAQQVGRVQLLFYGVGRCPPGYACSALVFNLTVTVT